MIECKICGKGCKDYHGLGIHIKKHDLSCQQYYDIYFKQNDNGLCGICQKQTKFQSIPDGYQKYCSCKCSAIGTPKLNNPVIQDKIKQTNIKKYGVDNPFKLKKVQESIRQKLLNDYGVDNISKLDVIKKKISDVKLSKSDYENEIINKKRENTCMYRYGVPNIFKIDVIKTKYIKTSNLRYGVDYPSQTIKIKQKIENTCLKRFGYKYPLQNKLIISKLRETCIKKYGVDNYNKTIYGRKKCRISAIRFVETQILNNEPLMPRIGNRERLFLDKLQKYTQYKIIRNDHSFAYTTARFPDGHIIELKLFIQFDEKEHFLDRECTQYKEDDIQCTKDLESVSGYKVFRVSEKRWKENQEDVINEFKQLLKKE